MTRETWIYEGYTIDKQTDTIVSPGKFEGEPRYVLDYWESVLNGFADEEVVGGDTLIGWFDVTDDDRAKFPELRDIARVAVWEDSRGFVHHRTKKRRT